MINSSFELPLPLSHSLLINPSIFRFRSLGVGSNIPLWYDLEKGDFELIDPVEYLIEERDIIANLGDNVTFVVTNHTALISSFQNLTFIVNSKVSKDTAFLNNLTNALSTVNK